MIKNQWYIVLSSKELKDKPIGLTRFGEKLVMWRTKDGIACISDRCAHRGASLSKGKVIDGHIQCPFHGFQYNPNGRVILIPANGRNFEVPENFKVKSYKAKEKNGFIFVFYGDEDRASTEPSFFDWIDESYSYAELIDPWKTHYSRCIENQLDPIHLPFVHYNTIGRGGRTIVDGPVVEWFDSDKMRFYMFSRKDDGTPPKKPEKLKGQKSKVYLEFIFPNLWQNHISDNFFIVAAFVPVDEENSLVYVRSYVKLTKVKFIDKLIAKFSAPFNRVILHQDRRVVETQIPKKTMLKMDENLVQGDLPIIQYRKRREELLQEKIKDI
jgi:phenylpropionate dioxygenase-like ring-hydroxylating dioxygenase large terminal subunit